MRVNEAHQWWGGLQEPTFELYCCVHPPGGGLLYYAINCNLITKRERREAHTQRQVREKLEQQVWQVREGTRDGASAEAQRLAALRAALLPSRGHARTLSSRRTVYSRSVDVVTHKVMHK